MLGFKSGKKQAEVALPIFIGMAENPAFVGTKDMVAGSDFKFY